MQIFFDTIMLMQQILYSFVHTRHDVKAQNLLLGKQGYVINMAGGIWWKQCRLTATITSNTFETTHMSPKGGGR